MLDNEPENTSENTAEPASTQTAAPPRRRRAATRPAGPPAPVDKPAEASATDQVSAEEPAAAPKRTRRTAKKTVADGEEKPPTRRRRKVAEAEPVKPEVVEPEAADPGAVEPEAVETGAVEPEAVEPASTEPDETATDEPAAEQLMADAPLETVEAESAQIEDTPAAEPETVETAAESSEDESEAVVGGTGQDDAGPDTASEAAEGEDDDSGNRRRRRRRGGRRRRRGSDQTGQDGSGETDADEESDTEQESSTDEDAPSDTSETGEGEGGRRRRRRRRRRGEDTSTLPDDPTEVVVRVREPRPARRSEEVSGIDGSTRMEAKRQRRREGREAGRRRPPILSEAEFLARRESVARKMIIRQREDLSQIAVIEDDILVEHYVDRDSAASLIGNVYLGRVQNVLPSMEAAFIDIGRGRNAVLYAGEVDWTSFGGEGQHRKIESVLKSGSTVLVQVTKDPVGAKGARLTNHVSIPGRYIVYAPGGHLSGISRKLPDVERKRLKNILSDLVPDSASVIVRTAAEGASEEELVRDVNRLKAQWEDIERKVKAGSAPQLLYGEPDLTLRIVRDLFTEDFAELIIQGSGSSNDAYDAVKAYVDHVAPHLHDRLRHWNSDTEGDLFGTFRLDEQIAKGLERKVFLPSGGSLVIDRTEAMTVIDVNTGKFTGSGGNLEATVTSNNLEAAEEVVRQLRLRDIGGIIVIDFIDMVLPNNRELLLRRLVECLGRDRTRHQVAEVTSLGLIQMTRKKIGTGLLEAFSTECPHCGGRGYEIHDMPVETQKQPDGGIRESRNRDRSRDGGGKRERSSKKKESAEPQPEVAVAGAGG